MTRDVDDAALMMATLSLPDVRDYASLKYEKLDWIVEPAPLKGLRVGLMMEAGCGVAPTPEVAAAVQRAAKDFEAAGAHVEPLKPFLTQDDARRPRQVLARARAQRHWRPAGRAARSRAAVHPRVGGICGGVFRRRGVSRLRPDTGDAQSGGRGDRAIRLRAVANRADDRFSRRMAVAQPRPAAIRFRISASPSPSICPSSRRHGQLRIRFATACRSGCRSSAVDLTILACWRSRALSRPFGRSRRGRGRSRRRPDRVAARALGVVVGPRKARRSAASNFSRFS